jgi:hypothetical protein
MSVVGVLCLFIGICFWQLCRSAGKPPKPRPNPAARSAGQAFNAWYQKYGVSLHQFYSLAIAPYGSENARKIYARLKEFIPDSPYTQFIKHFIEGDIEYNISQHDRDLIDGSRNDHLALLYWASYGKVYRFPTEFNSFGHLDAYGIPDYMKKPKEFMDAYLYLLELNGVEDLFWITDSEQERRRRLAGLPVIYEEKIPEPPTPHELFDAWYERYGVEQRAFLSFACGAQKKENACTIYARLKEFIPDNPYTQLIGYFTEGDLKKNIANHGHDVEDKYLLEHWSLLYWATYGKVYRFRTAVNSSGSLDAYGIPDYMKEPKEFMDAYIYLLERNGVKDLYWITDSEEERKVHLGL